MAFGSASRADELFYDVIARVDPTFVRPMNRAEQAARSFTAAVEKSQVAAGSIASAYAQMASQANAASTGGAQAAQVVGAIGTAAARSGGQLGKFATALGAFAAGGGLIGTVLVGATIVQTLFDRYADGARKAREETDRLIDSLVEAGRLRDNPAFRATKSREEGEKRLAELDRAIDTERNFNANGILNAEKLKKLEKERLEVIDAITEARNRENDAERKAAEEKQRESDELARKLEQQQATARRFRAELDTALANFTDTQVDDMQVALGLFKQKAEEELKKLPWAVHDEFRRAFNAAVEGFEQKIQETRVAEELEKLSLPGLRPRDEFRTLPQAGKTNLDAIQHSFTELVERAAAAARKHAESQEKIKREQRDSVRDTLLQAEAIEDAGRGALKLADAFGIASEESAEMLQNLVEIASAIKTISVLSKNDEAKLSDFIGPLLGGAGAIASLASQIFGGDSAAERRRREIQERNTEAIEQLTKRIGDFGLNVSGSNFAGLSAAVSAALVRNASGGSILDRAHPEAELREELAARGLNMAELRDLAEQLGLTFKPTLDGLEALQNAIAEVEFARFADTFAGQLQFLQAQFDIFDITDPIEQFKKLAEVATKAKSGSPALDKILGGIDVSTPEGRAAAEAAIREALERFNTEGGFSADDLGGLMPAELLQVLRDLERLLDEIETGPAGQTEGFNVDRTITQVTGERLASLFLGVQVNTGRAADTLDAILRSVSGGGWMPTIPPPPTPGGSLDGVVIGDINVHIATPVTAENAATLGRSMARNVAQEVSRELGKKFRRRQRGLGQG